MTPDQVAPLALNAWLFALLWAWSLRHTLFGTPKPLRGPDAARLLAQPVQSVRTY